MMSETPGSVPPRGVEGLVAGIPEAVRDRLRSVARREAFPDGVTIFTEGDRHRDLHVIESGSVRLEMFVPGRGRVPVLSLGPGDFLAWSAVLGGGTMTATAIACGPVTTIALDGEDLIRLCEAEHEVGYRLMRELSAALSRRLLATRLQLLDLFAEQTPVATPSRSAASRPAQP